MDHDATGHVYFCDVAKIKAVDRGDPITEVRCGRSFQTISIFGACGKCGAALGLATCAGEWREPDGGKPSLWLPRFDRVVDRGRVERLAVESFYSLAGVVQSGATVSHLTFIETLAESVENRGQGDQLADLVKEYVCRDLLDVVLGNSDNHGRNRAVLRGAKLELAPIYDLAPMVMDPEGVTRSTRWGEFERGGSIDWLGACRALTPWVSSSIYAIFRQGC